ncbi:WD40-like Beta Propeller Repeat [Nonomuraea solani]|uniref:WD40-like Beta Propeller Repeat n=1 Tax=Nonomuraea solani TaxID=1144553 RepID=A0A1H6F0F8_9ACTN|nr:caspase family protein [Nonomuraea solani]SEH02686.1 WD40-like Beta Propeller Repeat [Nonomuraea solani]
MQVADPERSRVILIGSSRYTDAELPDLPAVSATVRDLREFFTDPRAGVGVVPDRHCVTLLNAPSLEKAGDQIFAASRAAESLLLVYYVGHGVISGRKHDLYLSLPGTRPGAPEFSALEYGKLRDAVLHSPARVKIIVLDCCFSGRVLSQSMAPVRRSLLAELDIEGTYVLTSAGQSENALIVAGEKHTAFSGRLLRLLWEGVEDGGEFLTVEDLYRALRSRMRAAGLSTPERRLTQDAQLMGLTLNRAVPGSGHRAPSPPALATGPPRRRAVRLSVIPVLAVAALAAWNLRPDPSPHRQSPPSVSQAAPTLTTATKTPAQTPTKTSTPTETPAPRNVATIVGSFDAASFSPDGRTLAISGTDRRMLLRDMTTGRKTSITLAGTPRRVRPAVFSPDSKTVAVRGEEDQTVRLWSVPGHRWLPLSARHAIGTWAVAFTPDGRTLATGGNDRNVFLWDVTGQRKIATLRTDNGWIWSLAISPDGKLLAAGSADHWVYLWDLDTHRTVGKLPGTPDGVWGVAFSPDGKLLAIADGKSKISLWNARSRNLVATLHDGHKKINSLAFSPDGRYLASCGEPDTSYVFDVAARRKVAQYAGSVVFSRDRDTFATVRAYGDVKIWRTR